MQGRCLEEVVGNNVVLISEGKVNGVRTRGRPPSTWIDDTEEWINVKDYSEIKRSVEDRNHRRDLLACYFYIRRHRDLLACLLLYKKTQEEVSGAIELSQRHQCHVDL